MKRRVALILSAIALHSSWGPELKWLCNPVLSCHSCVLAWFACPIGVLVHYSGYHLFPWVALGTLLMFGTLVGRLFCGWVCPFGLVQDLMHRIPSPKIKLPKWTSWIKYVVLALMVVVFPFIWGEQTWLSFCRICPAAAIQVTLPGLIQNGLPTATFWTVVRLAFLAIILCLAIISSRSFCTVLCPIGAIMAPLNYISLWKVVPKREECLSCQKCSRQCPTDIQPAVRIQARQAANRHPDCIVCHDCIETCELVPDKKVSSTAAPTSPCVEKSTG
jgi:polyferredoxin